MIGLVVLVIIIAVAIVAQFIYDYDTDIVQQNIKERFQTPSAEHPFGTDQYGRDVLTRVLYGAKYSLAVCIVSVAISCVLGSSLGLIAGYYGGFTENLILRVCEVFAGIPSVLLGIAIMSAFGQSIVVLMFAIGLVYVPMFARTARAAVLPVRDQEYIEAARVSGVGDLKIIFGHVLPNAMSPIIVQVTMGVANGILTASSLSFLGLGDPNIMTWGMIIGSNKDYIMNSWWAVTFPGLAIFLVVLAIGLIGDGINDAFNPRLRRR